MMRDHVVDHNNMILPPVISGQQRENTVSAEGIPRNAV